MRDERSIIDERLERTAAFFEPTLPQAGDDPTHIAEGHGPEQDETKPDAKRSRRWEAQNPAHSYRSGDDLHEMLHAAKARYEDAGYDVSISTILRYWALAGQELWRTGQVEIPATPKRQEPRKVARP